MLNEERIRQHRDDLRKARVHPCNCPETGHDYECRHGAMLMTAVERALSWALGEEPTYTAMVNRIHRDVNPSSPEN